MISIIIPVLNEEDNIVRLLAELDREDEVHEVIVVDGGSADNTVRRAAKIGANILFAKGGRGGQLKAGIEIAKGDIVLMLHADSSFPIGGLGKIRRILDGNLSVPGGNFRLEFDGCTPFSDWITNFYAAIRRFGFYYGDSGIFVRRSVYSDLGGIRELLLMEDFDFVRRLESKGSTVCIDEPALVTSIRRFRGRRRIWIIIGWLYIHFLYYVGASPRWMVKSYDSERKKERAGVPIMGLVKNRKS